MPAQIKFKVDFASFNSFMKAAPDEFDKAAKEAMGKTVAKLRKEFIKTTETKHFIKNEKTDKYKSKYKKPLQMMKGLIRFKITGKKKINAVAGVFVGKAGKTNLKSSKFKSKYGVTLAKFTQLMTYGGKLNIKNTGRDGTRSGGIKRMIKQGFFAKKGTKFLKFPKRDWYSKTRFRRAFKLIPYLDKALGDKIDKYINQNLEEQTKRKKGVYK